MDAMAALEMALRIKAESEGFDKVKGMRNLLEKARKEAWVRGADLHYMKFCEEFRRRERILNEGKKAVIEVELPEVDHEKRRLDRLIDFLCTRRNDLARGDEGLYEGSPETLERCRDVINALFRP